MCDTAGYGRCGVRKDTRHRGSSRGAQDPAGVSVRGATRDSAAGMGKRRRGGPAAGMGPVPLTAAPRSAAPSPGSAAPARPPPAAPPPCAAAPSAAARPAPAAAPPPCAAAPPAAPERSAPAPHRHRAQHRDPAETPPAPRPAPGPRRDPTRHRAQHRDPHWDPLQHQHRTRLRTRLSPWHRHGQNQQPCPRSRGCRGGWGRTHRPCPPCPPPLTSACAQKESRLVRRISSAGLVLR